HRELTPPAEAVASYGRHDRRSHLADRVPLVDPPAEVEVEMGGIRELLDVGSGGERLLVPREDDAADRLILVEILERANELAHELVRECIQLLGAVQAHDRDRLLPLDEDRHFFSRNFLIASCGSSVAMERAS